MKTSLLSIFTAMLAAVLFLSIPSSSLAQNRNANRRSVVKSRSKVNVPQRPATPSPVSEKERKIKDLLFFPYGCLPNTVTTAESAAEKLSELFGSCENINGGIGLHHSPAFDFSYKGATIGLCYYDWFYNRQWYEFFFDTKADALKFYSTLTNDISQAGLPMKKDRIYGGMSTRNRSVSIFKEVYVFMPSLVKVADQSNIHRPEVVGKYVVEMGVYRK